MVWHGRMGIIPTIELCVVVVVVAVPKMHDSHSTTLVRDLLAKDT